MKVEKEERLKVALKNQELVKKIATLERERNDSVVKNAKIEKSILDAKKSAENATKGTFWLLAQLKAEIVWMASIWFLKFCF